MQALATPRALSIRATIIFFRELNFTAQNNLFSDTPRSCRASACRVEICGRKSCKPALNKMAKSEKSAQKSERDQYLQKKTKLEPTYKSAEFIDDSSSASEAATLSKRKTPVSSTSRILSTPSTKANPQDGSATKTEKRKERKKSTGTRTANSEGNRVQVEAGIQASTANEKGRVNGSGSTTADNDGSGERSPRPEFKNKHLKSPVKSAVSSTNIPQAEASTSGSSTSSASEEDDVEVPPATALEGKEDAVESNDEDDEVEKLSGARGEEEDSDAPSEGDNSADASESENSASSGIEQSASKTPPTIPAHSRRPIPAYQAPPDFEPAAISLGDAPSAERLFSTARLEGKELWHIVLPSFVPVSALKELPPQGILDESKFLSHDDSDYGLVPHRESSARFLLIPSHADNLFTPVNTAFAKSLRLQQLVKVPSHSVNPELRASASELSKKKRNQQPEGLRMRYQPFGVPDSSIVEPGADFDPSEQHVNAKQRKKEASQFKPPPEPLVEDFARKKEKKKKRKHGEIASSAPITPSSTQMKKARQDHPDLVPTSPPMQSPTLASTAIPRPGNSEPVMQAKPEDLITITNASPMELGQETLGPPADASPQEKHRHTLQNSPSVTPAQPKHDVSSSSNKGTNNKSHRKTSNSEENQRKKLLQPFRVPRSASPAQTPANGAHNTPTVDPGANLATTDGLDDRHATAGASPHDLSQRPKKRKKTHKSNGESMPLPSFPATATSLNGGVKARDFVKAGDLRVGADVDTAAASEPFSNSKIVETPSIGVDGKKGVGKQASKSHASSTPTPADIRIGERDMDASLPAAVNTSKDVVMRDLDSKSTNTPLDVAAERERKKQTKKALKEARKQSMGELKSDPIRSNGIGGVAITNASSPSFAVAKDAVVGEDPTMKNDSQPSKETERGRKKRERKERKKSNSAAEVKPVPAASPEFEPVSTMINHDTPSKGPSKTNSQLYEESERARKKMENKRIKKDKDAAQVNSGGMSANTSASVPAVPAKTPMANKDDAAPTNSQLYYEGERARKQREEEQRGEASKPGKKPTAPSNEVLPRPPPQTSSLAGNDDIAAARAKRKQGKKERRDERRRQKAVNAAAAAADSTAR